MELLPIEVIKIDQVKLDKINGTMKAIYRLILYSRHHDDDDLLDIYLTGIHNLQELLSIKNAQMEAQNEAEAKEYLSHLKRSLDFVIEEIILQTNFETEIQLFQLLRLISPETNAAHPNRYRQTLVQIGIHLCPEPIELPRLVSELFFKMQQIKDPIIRAIYFHHELIRIHPFVDGNGRVTRIAKNWMLMFHLYPPIFINDTVNKKEYINTLSDSFKSLRQQPYDWNIHTESFFAQELDRLITNTELLYESIKTIGLDRETQKQMDKNEKQV
jgi:Fic family protein